MQEMAESSEDERTRPWRGLLIMTVVIAAIAATSALAATVTQAPRIRGDASTGSKLTASAGSWTPSGATAEYAWLRCDPGGGSCQGITGACGRDYQGRAAGGGRPRRVRLPATESSGAAGSADSAPTAVVARKPYAIPGGDSDTCVHVKPTGPGKGTFTSGTQTGAGTKPPPDTGLPFIDPFPAVRIAGRFKGERTKLTR